MATAERPKMAFLPDEILFETYGQGPSPSKDFYQLVITQKEVIWRWWKISIRGVFRGKPPGEIKQPHIEFVEDSTFKKQLDVVFGPKILEYTLSLCRGHFDYLQRLPDQLLLNILSYLPLQDIGHISQTASRFRKVKEEFRRITAISLEETIMSKLDSYTPKLLEFMKAKGGVAGLKIQPILNVLTQDNRIETRQDAVIRSLIVYLGDVPDNLFKDSNVGNQEDFTQDIMKILAHGNRDEPVMSIVLEGSKVLTQCENTAKACALLMGLIYAFNLQQGCPMSVREGHSPAEFSSNLAQHTSLEVSSLLCETLISCSGVFD